MEKLSFRKIAVLIIIIFLLINLKAISNSIRSMCNWFGTSLNGLSNFSNGAQTAIAFVSVLLVVVLIFKTINK